MESICASATLQDIYAVADTFPGEACHSADVVRSACAVPAFMQAPQKSLRCNVLLKLASCSVVVVVVAACLSCQAMEHYVSVDFSAQGWKC